MKEHKIYDLLTLKLPCSNPESCWGWLTIQLFDKFNSIKSLNIYNMWVRNTHSYKTQVLDALNEVIFDEPSSKLNGKQNIQFCFAKTYFLLKCLKIFEIFTT